MSTRFVRSAMYATAMPAVSMGNPVTLRAVDDGTKVYGECAIYDTFYPQ